MFKYLLSILLLISIPAVADQNYLVKDVDNLEFRNGNLSDFWAEEIMGIDFVEEERLARRNQLLDEEVIVCDTYKKNHATHMSALVDGKYSINPSTYKDCTDTNSTLITLSYLPRRNASHQPIVNFSMDQWGGNTEDLYSLASKAIMVVSAGNDFDEGRTEIAHRKQQFATQSDAFIVGAMDRYGFPASYSQESEHVDILAPVDDSARAYCISNGEHCFAFGGTSSAAPSVTYTFKALRELLPGINRNHIKKLLYRTAIPLYSSIYPRQKNGKGMLNAFKMWRIALSLKEVCPNGSSSCIDSHIENIQPKVLRVEPTKSLMGQVFPGCSQSTINEPMSSTDKKDIFNSVREHFLLDPDRVDLKRYLSCAYALMGYLDNSVLYQNLNPARGKTVNPNSVIGSQYLYWNGRVGRYMTDNDAITFYTRLLSQGNDYTKKIARYSLPANGVIVSREIMSRHDTLFPDVDHLIIPESGEMNLMVNFLISRQDVVSRFPVYSFDIMSKANNFPYELLVIIVNSAKNSYPLKNAMQKLIEAGNNGRSYVNSLQQHENERVRNTAIEVIRLN